MLSSGGMSILDKWTWKVDDVIKLDSVCDN
jgi:hypothetical protein